MHIVVGQPNSLIKVECADGSMGSAWQRQVLGTTHAAADRCRADSKIVSIGTPPRDSKGSASLLTFSDDGSGSDLSFRCRGRWPSPQVSDGESAQRPGRLGRERTQRSQPGSHPGHDPPRLQAPRTTFNKAQQAPGLSDSARSRVCECGGMQQDASHS